MQNEHAQRVADTVRAEMARRRIGQRDLAAALKTSQGAVSRRLTGTVPFDVAELHVVARVLDVPVSVLLGEAPAVSA